MIELLKVVALLCQVGGGYSVAHTQCHKYYATCLAAPRGGVLSQSSPQTPERLADCMRTRDR
jgi:hypothetical protein